MAALIVFIVFLIAIAVSVPIGVAHVPGHPCSPSIL